MKTQSKEFFKLRDQVLDELEALYTEPEQAKILMNLEERYLVASITHYIKERFDQAGIEYPTTKSAIFNRVDPTFHLFKQRLRARPEVLAMIAEPGHKLDWIMNKVKRDNIKSINSSVVNEYHHKQFLCDWDYDVEETQGFEEAWGHLRGQYIEYWNSGDFERADRIFDFIQHMIGEIHKFEYSLNQQ